MQPDELKAFRKMVCLSQGDMAAMLGYGRRQYQLMERGMGEIRNCVDLACAAYAMGIIKYDGPQIREQWEGRIAKGREQRAQ